MANAPTGNEPPSLRGKTIVIHLRNRSTTSPIVLSECTLETRGGRIFLVGISLPARRAVKDWCDGVRRAVAWDAVDEYLLFQSSDDYYACEPPVTASASVPAPRATFEAAHPVEPSGIAVEPSTPLDIGSIVLAYGQGRWWRAEVIALVGADAVTVRFPGAEAKGNVTIPRGELQVYLGGALDRDDSLRQRMRDSGIFFT